MSKKNISYISGRAATISAGEFAKQLTAKGAGDACVFDSATEEDFASGKIDLPPIAQEIYDSAGADEFKNVMAAFTDGIRIYEDSHGVNIPPDVVEQALHNVREVYDSVASSDHSNNTSLVAEQAIVSIYSTLTAAIPFAHYAPADLKSGEARIAIVKHVAGTNTGMYKQNQNLDGVNSGEVYLGQARAHTVAAVDGTGKSTLSGKITAVMTGRDACDQAAAQVVLRRGRTVVSFNGYPVAVELSTEGSGNSGVAGNFEEGGTPYSIGGNINTDTGVFELTVTPMIAEDTEFVVEALLDVERDPSLIPSMKTEVSVKSVLADSWTCYATTTLESINQMQNELKVNPHQASMIAINSQLMNERHHKLLNYGIRLARSNSYEFDLDYAARKAEKTIPEMFQDFSPVLSKLSQAMAEQTNSNGASFAYISKKLLSYFLSLSSDIFIQSGLPQSPGIYRVGRLVKGGVDVYYTPTGLAETATSAEMLVIGRSAEVARSAFILGDVSSPQMEQTGKDQSLAQNVAMHAKNFTTLNPHRETLKSVAMINVIGLPSD
jgi:uncharacterized Zn-binding protein involved in type VI secretion